ncbi:hypothetical protein PRK78_005760 [Emydomyces testavorans]|uniref:CBM21 domain-containing protein n=1 Tax=Emydomyces testavorans TaxID=2070801 RepID=A0AAF0DP33_9EURO|nr:hypothetical protein PRK78_005760 [Emydomyces testavorans]
MATSRAFPLPSYRDDDLAAAGAKMLSRSVQRMSAKIIKSALPPLASSSQRSKSKSSKSVHFEAHLESVCYFMKDDEPCLIAARISAVKRTNGDCDPLHSLSKETPLLLHDSTCVLDLISQSAHRAENDVPVRVEQVYLSNEKNVTGTLAVANISFAKHVKVRFTLDGWKTVSETAAEYFGNHRNKGFDTFGFTIRLEDQDALKNKTMSFCVCYVANNGKEFLDNNDSRNYQIEFSKLAKQASQNMAAGDAPSVAKSLRASSSATLKSGSPPLSPPGILRPTTPNPKLHKPTSTAPHHSRFASFSRQSKSQAANTHRKQNATETSQTVSTMDPRLLLLLLLLLLSSPSSLSMVLTQRKLEHATVEIHGPSQQQRQHAIFPTNQTPLIPCLRTSKRDPPVSIPPACRSQIGPFVNKSRFLCLSSHYHATPAMY